MNPIYLFILISLTGILNSCISVLPASRNFSYCYPNNHYTLDSSFLPYNNLSSIIQKDSGLTKRYSIANLNLANALGIINHLDELNRLEKEYSIHHSLELQVSIIEKKQQIINRIIVCKTEIASITAELDCEGERAEQISSYMTNKKNSRVNKLTVASITAGALGGVVAIAIKPKETSEAVAIAGGLGSASLGLLSLTSSRKTEFMHPRNLLSDIWMEPENSDKYPYSIWYILTHKEFSNKQEFTLCHNIKERWEKYEELTNKKSKNTEKQIQLLFGTGGIYSSDQLHVRSQMINQLQALIKLIDQDLQFLLYAIE